MICGVILRSGGLRWYANCRLFSSSFPNCLMWNYLNVTGVSFNIVNERRKLVHEKISSVWRKSIGNVERQSFSYRIAIEISANSDWKISERLSNFKMSLTWIVSCKVSYVSVRLALATLFLESFIQYMVVKIMEKRSRMQMTPQSISKRVQNLSISKRRKNACTKNFHIRKNTRYECCIDFNSTEMYFFRSDFPQFFGP